VFEDSSLSIGSESQRIVEDTCPNAGNESERIVEDPSLNAGNGSERMDGSAASADFLEWKDKGRPDCPRCLKSHFGDCKGPTKWESDLLERDPEEYARHLRRMKKQRSRRKQRVKNTSQPPRQALQPPEIPEPSMAKSEMLRPGRQRQPIAYYANDPWVIKQATATINECSPSQLEDLRRWAKTKPIMAAAIRTAEKQLEDSHSAEWQPFDGPQELDVVRALDGATATSVHGQLYQDETPGPRVSYLEMQTPIASRHANSPVVLKFAAAVIKESRSLSDLEDLQRYAEKEPHLAVVAQMAALAVQQWRLRDAHTVESQPPDGIRETNALRPPFGVAATDTQNSGPFIDFRTIAEHANSRDFEQGDPSAKAEGK
jgi:hypothetical protein